MVYEAVEAIESTINNKNQSISYHVHENLPKVLIDQDMIRRVVTNLLENASKYSPAGNDIEVGARLRRWTGLYLGTGSRSRDSRLRAGTHL